MRLSMWVLADWLKCYNPQIKIQDGRRTLRNVRLYSENQRMDASTVYLGAASDFIDGMPDQINLRATARSADFGRRGY